MWVLRALIALLFAALIILIDLPLHLITSLIEKAPQLCQIRDAGNLASGRRKGHYPGA